MSWYSAKCVFRHNAPTGPSGKFVYEERIIVLRADDLDEAIRRVEEEAHEYSAGLEGVEFTGFVAAYDLGLDEIDDLSEVYSILRDSDLEAEAFLDRYYDDGSERTQHVGRSV